MDNFKQQQIETCKRYIINESLFGQQYDQLLEMMQEMREDNGNQYTSCGADFGYVSYDGSGIRSGQGWSF